MKNSVFSLKKSLVMVFVLGVVFHLTGCKPAKSDKLTPAQQTQSVSLLTEMRKNLSPMLSQVVSTPNVVGYGENGTGAQAFLSDADRDKCLAYLRQAKTQYSSTPEGESALMRLGVDFRQLADQARAQGRWRLVVAAIDATTILDPQRKDLEALRARAQAYVDRPDVVIGGFMEDGEKNQVYAFLTVTLHPSGEEKSVHARKGDEFYGLRFVDIIGDLRGIKLEYLKIPGEFYSIMRPH